MKAQTQPQARDLEVLILGAILLESDAYDKVINIIDVDTFYVDAHKKIFESIKNLKSKSENVDLYTVVEELKKNNNLDNVGGVTVVAGLTNALASSANIEQHARIIKEKQLRREIISICSMSIKNAFDDTEDVFDSIVKLSLGTSTLLDAGSTNKLDKLNDVTIFNHKDRKTPKQGQKSKFKDLPDYKKGKVYVVGARPGMGKTTFAINEGYRFSKDGVVFMASLEMPSEEVVTKIESLESRIPSYRIEKNKIYKDEEQKYDKLKLLDTNFFIDDTPAVSLTHLKTRATKLKKEKGLDMIIIDYLQLMKGDKGGNREQEIGSISRGLKELAKTLNVPIIALSQLSREVEKRQNKRPMLSDLRESGSIEQDADVITFLFRPMYYAEQSGDKSIIDATDPNLVEAIVAKHRGGRVGKYELSCDLSISEFTDKKDLVTGGDYLEEDFNF